MTSDYQEVAMKEIRKHISVTHNTRVPSHYYPGYPSSSVEKHRAINLPFGLRIVCDVILSENRVIVQATDIMRHKRWEKIHDYSLMGVSKCSPNDSWDYSTGYRIALNRLVSKLCLIILKAVPLPEGEAILCSSS